MHHASLLPTKTMETGGGVEAIQIAAAGGVGAGIRRVGNEALKIGSSAALEIRNTKGWKSNAQIWQVPKSVQVRKRG